MRALAVVAAPELVVDGLAARHRARDRAARRTRARARARSSAEHTDAHPGRSSSAAGPGAADALAEQRCWSSGSGRARSVTNTSASSDGRRAANFWRSRSSTRICSSSVLNQRSYSPRACRRARMRLGAAAASARRTTPAIARPARSVASDAGDACTGGAPPGAVPRPKPARPAGAPGPDAGPLAERVGRTARSRARRRRRRDRSAARALAGPRVRRVARLERARRLRAARSPRRRRRSARPARARPRVRAPPRSGRLGSAGRGDCSQDRGPSRPGASGVAWFSVGGGVAASW